MATYNLPKQIDYTQKMTALPSATSTTSVVLSPVNGATFNFGGDVIQFDLPNRSFLIGSSMVLRYKMAITNAVTATTILATPAMTPFSRCETTVGGAVIESISDYNVVNNMIVNTKLNIAQKVGSATALGYDAATPAFNNMNSRSVAVATATHSLAFPVNSIFSNAETLIPLGMMGGSRIQFTTDSLINCFGSITNISASSLQNLELVCDIVDFGEEVNAIARGMADQNGNLLIKSQSFSNTTLSVPAASAGNLELTFNTRISSIKSLFALFSSADGSKKFNACDITKSVGTTQFFVANLPFPVRPIDHSNKAGVMLELAAAWNNVSSIDSFNSSITAAEFAVIDGTADSALVPGKFYLGVNTERLGAGGGGALLSGVSSQLSPISVRVSLPTATTDIHNCSLIAVYDALIEVNVITRQVNVKS